jgi:hypothetical protein
VHRHHAHRVERLGLERRLALAGLDRVAFRERVDEAAQVAPLVRLVLARHPHELANVGHAARAAGQGEQVAVVPGERDGSVDQRLKRHLSGDPALRLEAVRERGEAGPVLGGQLVEQLGIGLAAAAPQRGAQRPPRVASEAARPQADQRNGVEREAHEGRGEERVHGQPVQRVGERRQPVTQVHHLLLPPVAASADHVHRNAAVLERALEQAHRGRGAEQHHHVPVRPQPIGGELLDPLGQQPSLGRPPRRRRVHRLSERVGLARQQLLPAALRPVHHEQVHARGRAWLGLARAGRRAQRFKALAPGALEGEVDRVEDLPAGAEVDGDALRAPLPLGALPVAAEHAHVRVPEAVDRLVFVADAEQVVARKQLQQLVLELVRVLKLVHQDVLEARRVRLAEAHVPCK